MNKVCLKAFSCWEREKFIEGITSPSKDFDKEGIVRKGKAICNFNKPCLKLVSQFLLVDHPKKYMGGNSQNIALYFTLLH
jgi:hypothetical protein